MNPHSGAPKCTNEGGTPKLPGCRGPGVSPGGSGAGALGGICGEAPDALTLSQRDAKKGPKGFSWLSYRSVNLLFTVACGDFFMVLSLFDMLTVLEANLESCWFRIVCSQMRQQHCQRWGGSPAHRCSSSATAVVLLLESCTRVHFPALWLTRSSNKYKIGIT